MDKKQVVKNRIITFVLWFGFAVVSAIFLYPSWTNTLNNIFQTNTIYGYEDRVSDLGSDVQGYWDYANLYNQMVYDQQKQRAFQYQGEKATDEYYEYALKVTDDEIMGYIEVPSADIYLPIAHGTKTPQLEYESGHMYGTSVPVGGESTHSVIAGHTGLPRADIFTNLTKVKMGDVFYIHVLDKVLEYTVDDINVVWPEDESPYLQIVDGKDYITLYTCTPYGINDHRLLIRGTHTNTTSAGGEAGEDVSVMKKNKEAIIKLVGISLIPILILIIGIIKTIREGKEKRCERSL